MFEEKKYLGSSSNRFRLGAILSIAVVIHLVATILLATGNLSSILIPGHRWTFPGCDLWSLVQAGFDVRNGAGIYTPEGFHPAIWGPIGFPYVLPPWIAVIIGIPLSFLSPWGAHAVFWLLLEAALAALAFVCWRLAGRGLAGTLAASLCLIAAPQMVELYHGQTDTFIALGLALSLWGLSKGGKLARGLGMTLLMGIKPIGFFYLPSLFLRKQRRGLAFIALGIFILMLMIAFFITVTTNTGVIETKMTVFSALQPGDNAFSLNVQRPQNDYVFQFFKFLLLGRSGPTNHYFPTDQGPMNLMRVIGLPWAYFAIAIVMMFIVLTWRYRRVSTTELVVAWMLLPLWVMPVVWDTYYLLSLPLAATLVNLRKDFRPLVAALILVLPSPLGPLPNAVEQPYPLPSDFAVIVMINLTLRAIALAWLTYMAWHQCILQGKKQNTVGVDEG